MTIQRSALLSRLNEAAPGLSQKAVLEQSDCFVFANGRLTTFNDDIMVRVESPLDFDVVVNATKFLAMVGKIPDEELEVYLGDGEIRVKGKKRTAGLTCTSEVHLPMNDVPSPEKWHKLPEGILATLQQAARTCGKDETQYLTTVVHVTPQRVEASDGSRLFRADGPTGFPSEVLIPACSVHALEGLEVAKVSIGQGWVHTQTAGGAEISIRCSHEKYIPGVDAALTMVDEESVTLPGNLAEMIERAEIFTGGSYDAKVGIRLEGDTLTITSREETGWYREAKRVRYTGRTLEFDIHPKFLTEILERTRDVLVDARRMKLVTENIQFVVVLVAKQAPAEEPAGDTPDAEE